MWYLDLPRDAKSALLRQPMQSDKAKHTCPGSSVYQLAVERQPMPTGVVYSFVKRRGYGFITPDDSTGNREENVYVHITQCLAPPKRGLLPGMRVSYELIPGQNGRSVAGEVTVLD
eukprot:g37479.t1